MVIMELNKEIDNPGFDGRKRSGWQSQKLFAKGTRFALMGAFGGLSAKFIGANGEPFDDQKLIVALLSASTPSDARNYAEIATTLPEPIAADAVLDRLLAEGVVTEAQVRAAAVAGVEA